MASVPKRMLHNLAHETRHLLRAESMFRQTHQERHYLVFIKHRDNCKNIIQLIDEKELEN